MLKLHVLGSGSKGNAALVEESENGSVLALDCGLCARDFMKGLDHAGIEPERISAFLITHENSDHTKGLGAVLRSLRRRGVHVPVFVEDPARHNSKEIASLENDFALQSLRREKWLFLDGIEVFPFATSHDAASSCGFRFEQGSDALGYLTDSGVVEASAHDALHEVRILALEANHDEEMLRTGPYPYVLKKRVGSNQGHLSNRQAAEELQGLLWSGLQQVVAMHISQNNNSYQLPIDALKSALGSHEAQVSAALQDYVVRVG